jgi:guanosine-3',5'-bis(diphosphate) 3'-pyrophosphohydrolase
VDYTNLAKAIVFACERHRGQKRSEADGEVEYVVHPLRVAEHVRRFARVDDVEILCAAVLHDTIEDSGTRYDELAAAFGHRVAQIVAELTNDSRLPKAERHEDMIRRAATMSPEAKLIKLADRYDNLLHVARADPGKRQRILSETPRLLAALHGACPAIETEIEKLLAQPVHRDAGTPRRSRAVS